MRAVSNTSPISSFAAIGRLSLLQTQFDEVWIPPGVEQELLAHPDKVVLATLDQALKQPWIRRATPSNSGFLNLLLLSLHRGEAEAIALAAELKTDFVLIDEQEGRQLAAQAGLSVTGVLGILLRAKHDGHIPALKPEIESLRHKARFFLSTTIEAKILSSTGE